MMYSLYLFGYLARSIGSAQFAILFGIVVQLAVHNFGNGCYSVFSIEANNAHTLCGTTHYAQLLYGYANSYPALIDNHNVVVIGYIQYADEVAGFLGDVQGCYALSATVGNAVDVFTGFGVGEVAALAVSFF